MRIKIIDNTYLGKTDGVKVTATSYVFMGKASGYLVLGKDLIDADVDTAESLDPDFEYYLNNQQVKVIQP